MPNSLMNAGRSTVMNHPRLVDVRQVPWSIYRPRIVDPLENQGLTIRGMDYKKECGARVAKLREERGWTLRELSTRTGDVLLPTRISNYETGERLLSQQEAVILAKALGTRPAFLLAVDDIQLPITQQEEALIRNWRTLPERERMEYFRKLEMLAMTYRDPVSEARVELHRIPAPQPMPKVAVHKKVKR